jgi:hypothetical protein
VSALATVAAAADPALRGHVVAEPAGARYEHLGPDRAFVLEAVREGYELHYGEPRVFAGMDSDLALLAGDALYALGLSRLAELGDLPAVAELADLISLCAQAQAAQRPDLAEELWTASALALSPGGGPGARATVGERLARSA